MSQAQSLSTVTSLVSGDDAVLARRYAGALFALASEQNQLDAVASDLRGLRQLCQESAAFQFFASNPRFSRDQLVQMAKQVAETAKLNPLTGNFLALVAQNRRLSQLGAVIDGFLADLALQRGEHTADVRVARALSPAQQEQLSLKLQELVGGTVHLSLKEDATLLGGIVIKLGSRLIDASVKNKLSRIERQLKKGAA